MATVWSTLQNCHSLRFEGSGLADITDVVMVFVVVVLIPVHLLPYGVHLNLSSSEYSFEQHLLAHSELLVQNSHSPFRTGDGDGEIGDEERETNIVEVETVDVEIGD
ncbi:hypothetical protein HK098_002948 [Nowakowskiella sp. JEL0407]|nr:hypothetical protein HK098_002948 [Nowakowskiella sp. JEL0407]